MAMYRVDVYDVAEDDGLDMRWKPDSYWDDQAEAEEFLEQVKDNPWKMYRVVEVFGEVIF